MMGSNAVATMAANLLLATMLLVAMALLIAPPASPPSRATGRLRSGEMKQQGLREMGAGKEGVGDDAHRRELLLLQERTLAGEEDGGEYAGVVPPLFQLSSEKRQVPTGADPIHHNERPPSLPHHHFP